MSDPIDPIEGQGPIPENPIPPQSGAAAEVGAEKAAEAVVKPGMFSQIRDTWNQSSLGVKFARGAGAAVGVILIGTGLKNLGRFAGFVSPKLDESGKDIQPGGGTLVKSAAQIGAGAGALFLAARNYGGKGASMGLSA